MTKTERYRLDPEFRDRCKERTRRNHLTNAGSQTYLKLIAIRKSLWQVEESISNYRAKIAALQSKRWALTVRKEKLELAFGKERAERKRRERTSD